MRAVPVLLALTLGSACGKYSVIGFYGGGVVGAGIGTAAAEDNGDGAVAGALVGAVIGVLVGGIIDFIERPLIKPDH